MAFWSGVKAALGFEGVGDTALKIVEKLTGTDDSPAQKREFYLKAMEATKHQSPARRAMAMCFMAEQMMLVTVWTVSVIIGNYWGLVGAKETATAVSGFLTSNVNVTINIIIGFYFLVGAKR
jgi:hypothetical protein